MSQETLSFKTQNLFLELQIADNVYFNYNSHMGLQKFFTIHRPQRWPIMDQRQPFFPLIRNVGAWLRKCATYTKGSPYWKGKMNSVVRLDLMQRPLHLMYM